MKIVLDVKLYTLEEVAELLGLRVITISKYIQQGKIKAKKIGIRKYVTEESLKEYLLTYT